MKTNKKYSLRIKPLHFAEFDLISNKAVHYIVMILMIAIMIMVFISDSVKHLDDNYYTHYFLIETGDELGHMVSPNDNHTSLQSCCRL